MGAQASLACLHLTIQGLLFAKSRFDGVTKHQAHTLRRTSPNSFND
jgi:hypothetical protein